MKIFIEFNSDQPISADELPYVGNFQVEILPTQQLLGNVLNDSIQAQLGRIFWHVGVGRYLYKIHFSNWNIPSGAHRSVGPES